MKEDKILDLDSFDSVKHREYENARITKQIRIEKGDVFSNKGVSGTGSASKRVEEAGKKLDKK